MITFNSIEIQSCINTWHEQSIFCSISGSIDDLVSLVNKQSVIHCIKELIVNGILRHDFIISEFQPGCSHIECKRDCKLCKVMRDLDML